MTTIRTTTKRGQTMYDNATENYEGYYLNDVYGNYSYAKYKAWEYCLNLCQKEGGNNFHITSHNTFGFTVSWWTVDGLRIETARNSYLILID